MYIQKFCINTVLCYFPPLELFHSTSDDSALLSQCLLCLYFRLNGLRGEQEMRMCTLRNEKVFSKVLTSLKPYLSTVHYQMLSYLTSSHYHRLYDNDDNLLLIRFYTIHLHQLAARVSRLLRSLWILCSIFSDRLPCNFQKMNYFSCFKRIGMFSLSLYYY